MNSSFCDFSFAICFWCRFLGSVCRFSLYLFVGFFLCFLGERFFLSFVFCSVYFRYFCYSFSQETAQKTNFQRSIGSQTPSPINKRDRSIGWKHRFNIQMDQRIVHSPCQFAQIRMSIPHSELDIRFSPLHAILQDGLDRMLEIVKSGDLMFIVNGESVQNTIVEATLISPKVHEMLRFDPSIRSFNILGDDCIDATSFGQFLKFVLSHECPTVSHDQRLNFLSLCRSVGNE
jgi:hypothetical protein